MQRSWASLVAEDPARAYCGQACIAAGTVVTQSADPLATLAHLLAAEGVCACSSQAGALLVAVAASMAGGDLTAVLRLPDGGEHERRVVVQRAHMVEIGGVLLAQLLRLAGVVPVEVGAVDGCRQDELAAALADGAAAGVHVERDGPADAHGVGIAGFVWACREAGVQSIVVLVGSTGPLAALDAGADLVVLDVAHAFGGPACGLIAGRADRIAACALQGRGLGALFGTSADVLAAVVAAIRAAGDDRARQPA